MLSFTLTDISSSKKPHQGLEEVGMRKSTPCLGDVSFGRRKPSLIHPPSFWSREKLCTQTKLSRLPPLSTWRQALWRGGGDHSFEISDRGGLKMSTASVLKKGNHNIQGKKCRTGNVWPMLHHKISKEFYFGSFTASSQDFLDFYSHWAPTKWTKKKKISDIKMLLKVSNVWSRRGGTLLS